MTDIAKSGTEIVADFFKGLPERTDLDKNVTQTLCSLHAEGKLTPIQISNALEKLREEMMNVLS